MSIRRQLLLVSLLTLLLPWAGCQYVTELESALRQGQQDSLEDSAGAIASILQERRQLLYRYRSTLTATRDPISDIYAHPISSAITLDGFSEDWPLEAAQFRKLHGGETSDGTLEVRFAVGANRNQLFLFIAAKDDRVIWRNAQPGFVHDQIRLVFWDQDEQFVHLVVHTDAPGEVRAEPLPTEPHRDFPANLIRGNWQPTAAGYNLELTVPQDLIGPRFGFAVVDGDAQPLDPLPFLGTVDIYDLTPLPALLTQPLPELNANVNDLTQQGRRLRLLDRHGWILAEGGRLDDTPSNISYRSNFMDRLYRRILDPGLQPYANAGTQIGNIRGPDVQSALNGNTASVWYQDAPGSNAVISASAPIYDDEHVAGVVTLEQTSASTLLLTNNALKRILSVTLISTALVVTGLLGFATLVSLRIRRLRNATEQAMAADGELSTDLPGVGASDELGDLSRSFESLLLQLKDYTQYLKSLAGKLSHELRTPLAVVQSSLDNLQSQPLEEQSQVYAQRATAGVNRLRHIVRAMSAASRVEQSIATAQFETFDLAAFTRDMALGYQDTYASHVIEAHVPNGECQLYGVADLLAQMLDKLVENAVDFAPPGAVIAFHLEQTPKRYTLRVSNEGPPLPQQMKRRVFDSLISLREQHDNESTHLGFGLFIARLVVTLHQGEILADNLPNDEGVEFRIDLPRRYVQQRRR